ANIEHPDQRDRFKHPDLITWVSENKNCLVWSAVTLIQAWIAGGQPKGTKPLGKFESWAAVIGGILHVAGISGFLHRVEAFREQTDIESNAITVFVEAWAQAHGEKEVFVSDLVPLSFLDLGGGNEHSRSIRLGQKLNKLRGRRFGPWKIEKKGLSAGRQRWRLKTIDEDG